MPTAINEIQHALGDSAADFQAAWESSAGGVTNLKGPSRLSLQTPRDSGGLSLVVWGQQIRRKRFQRQLDIFRPCLPRSLTAIVAYTLTPLHISPGRIPWPLLALGQSSQAQAPRHRANLSHSSSSGRTTKAVGFGVTILVAKDKPSIHRWIHTKRKADFKILLKNLIHKRGI
ncbi:hypothetical protein ACN38_g10814 [Penicillium nordicum]|uniref:Uncharacterized protein n=1 Tax=Penicillium nordicum TaxID=229535 RepID=A0A0M8NZU1_9EURO|nr:hypothetical protein ACN38_g10814 [Penicillium nordicum]